MFEAVFTEMTNTVTVRGLTQWDQGQLLKITGLNLQRLIEVHFENVKLGTALIRWGVLDEDGNTVVAIPNDILTMPHDFKAWLVEIDEHHRKTTKTVMLPLVLRAQPADYLYLNDNATYNALNELTEYVNVTYEEIKKISTDTAKKEQAFEEKVTQDFTELSDKNQKDFKQLSDDLTQLVHDLTDGVTIVKVKNFTITPSMWTQGNGKWIGKITDERVGDKSVVNVTLHDEYEGKVEQFGLQTITESFVGYFEVYADKQVTENLIIDFSMM